MSMRIRMLVAMSGTCDGRQLPRPGVEADVSDARGAQLCAKGLAAPVAEDKDSRTEKAVAPEPEKRTGLTTEDVPAKRRKTSSSGE